MKTINQPILIHRDNHCISRKNISHAALKVMYRLHDKGYIVYLAGGAVRDLMLHKKPHDFDIVTNATPDQIKKIFKNCRIVGRRFRLAHILFKNEIIETSTFRASITEGHELSQQHLLEKDDDGIVIRDNLFGQPNEDALRRDFTINALFYNIADYHIIDYTNGLDDLNKKNIKVIGDPDIRFTEDPVRMIRAIRFSSTLNFKINPADFKSIEKNAHLLKQTSSSRMYEELQKLFFFGKAEEIYKMLDQTNLIRHMFINFMQWSDQHKNQNNWVQEVLKQLDKWSNAKLKIRPSLMLALIFGEYHEECIKKNTVNQKPSVYIIRDIIHNHLLSICDQIRIPKTVIYEVCDIMTNQLRFEKKNQKQSKRFIKSPQFLSAFLYLKFSTKINKRDPKLLNFWSDQRTK